MIAEQPLFERLHSCVLHVANVLVISQVPGRWPWMSISRRTSQMRVVKAGATAELGPRCRRLRKYVLLSVESEN